MNVSNETLDAENPKPLKPLTRDAKSITLQKNKIDKFQTHILQKFHINYLF